MGTILTQNKHIQTKLRQELSKLSTDNPTMDDLNGLPGRCRTRNFASLSGGAVPNIIRVATKDDCISLSKPFTGRNGIVHNEIRLVLMHFRCYYISS